MTTMLKVKVCGMTDPLNTAEMVRAKPDLTGFIFYPGSKRFVGMKPEGSLFDAVPSGILKTGVFVGERLSVIIDTVNRYGLDAVQLHGKEPPGFCAYLKGKGLKIIKAFGISNNYNFKEPEYYSDVCDFFLFDTKTGNHGGSGTKFDWSRINEYHVNKPFFLSGGIEPRDASIIKKINHACLFGVDINSCFETSPGIKDIKKVKEFIEEIKV